MGWGIAIVLIFGVSLGLLIYLYQEHVDYLNKQIKDLKFELEFTGECLDAHKEMVEDLEGYYEKWRETVAELDEANQKIWEYKANLEETVKRIGEYEKELDMR
jgi:uncharacterized coiled-coil DUF342 family protein